jgi:L-alanine-DL-glutamate epimerase-like enolase superfamily enzyme
MIFKQLLQLDAIDVCQIDSCRLSGVNEILSVLMMSAKFGIPVCPHAGEFCFTLFSSCSIHQPGLTSQAEWVYVNTLSTYP